MKKLLFLLTAIFLIGCAEPINRYKGSVIINKKHVFAGYKIASQEEYIDNWGNPGVYLYEFYVYKYDYERFELGDTIK